MTEKKIETRYPQVEVKYHLQPFVECMHCKEVEQVEESGAYLKHLCSNCHKASRYTPHEATEKALELIYSISINADERQLELLKELQDEINSFKTRW